MLTACVGAALVLSVGAVPAGAAPSAPAESPDVAASTFDLGVRYYQEPLEGAFARMPVRLWGTIAAPTGPGPYPLVIIGHGAHGDNCPLEDDFGSWPCFDVEQRNDLGFTWLARKFAERGMVAVAADMNSAYTGGWGEIREYPRFARVYDQTLAAVKRANSGEGDFPIDLTGRVDTSRIGVLGHSRGGFNSVKWANKNPEVASLFLLAPYTGPRPLPDIPVSVAVGTCDGDTRMTGLRYVKRAEAKGQRTKPMYAFTATGPNHNYYNRTLVKLKSDDSGGGPGCSRSQRPTPKKQQRWLAEVAGAHFAATLTTPSVKADFLRTGGTTIAGIATQVQRYRPKG
jgi:dienelactone hydrolase